MFDILLNILLSVSFSAARDRFNKDDILLNGGKRALNLWQIQIFSDISYVTLKMLLNRWQIQLFYDIFHVRLNMFALYVDLWQIQIIQREL